MESLIRNYTRVILKEISKIPPSWFSTIDAAVLNSRFWELPNDDEDDPDREGSGKTPAAAALETSLQSAFDELELDMDVIVDSYFTDDVEYMLHPDHPAYPNRWLIDARWYVSKIRPGRNTIDMMLMLGDEDSGFNASDVDPEAITRHIAQTIRHELVHYTQMKKQSLNKQMYSDIEAFQDMLDDPSQIPNQDNKKYWEVYEKVSDENGEEIIEKSGFREKLYTQDYLRSHIEIDAHAHDGAEELLAVYGKEKSLDMLRRGFDTSDPKMPNAIKHYFNYLPDGDSTLTKLRKKLYSYIQHFSKSNETYVREHIERVLSGL